MYFHFETERMNFYLKKRKKELFISLSPVQAIPTLFHNTFEKFRFTAPVLVPKPGHRGLFCSVPANRSRGDRSFSLLPWCKSLRLKIVYSLTTFCPHMYLIGWTSLGWDDLVVKVYFQSGLGGNTSNWT